MLPPHHGTCHPRTAPVGIVSVEEGPERPSASAAGGGRAPDPQVVVGGGVGPAPARGQLLASAEVQEAVDEEDDAGPERDPGERIARVVPADGHHRDPDQRDRRGACGGDDPARGAGTASVQAVASAATTVMLPDGKLSSPRK